MASEQHKVQQQQFSNSNASVSSVNPKQRQAIFLIALDTNVSNSPNFSKSENATLLVHADILKPSLPVANNTSAPSPVSDANIATQPSETFISEHNYGVNLDETDEEEVNAKPFVCSACSKSFLYNCTLRRHIRKFHSSNSTLLESLRPKKPLIYRCDKCPRKFSSRRNLVFHQRRKHDAEQYIPKKNHICSICQGKFKKNEITNHYTLDHGIEIKKEELHFRTFEHFMSWKWDIEMKTESTYVMRHHYYHKDGAKLHFLCQRSGNFETRSKGLRRLKRQGSTKINAYCPAAIYITEFKDGTCTVTFLPMHIGHENNLGHLSEICNEINALTSNHSDKSSVNEIEHEINESESECQEFHLLTKNDLNNIEKSFKFSNDIEHANDCDNVDIWMQELQNCQNPCVLFYKLQGQKSDFSCLDNNDFLLVIMTKTQEEILKKFSIEYICIDRTQSVNSYGYELITLLALDNRQRGLPCAFLVTNRTDETVLSIFFSLIKRKVGELHPKIFLSDVESTFYDTWVIEMGMPIKHLFCAWHVDWSWRKNLTKINGREKQIKVYETLKSLLYEQDTVKFNVMMKTVVEYLNEDPDTKKFASYFKTYYERAIPAWASCHKIKSGLNVDMQIEKMHQTLKYIYLCKKEIKRLDLVMYCIMRFIRSKMIVRSMISSKKKLAIKLKAIANRHKASTVMVSQILNDKSEWLISSENNEIYHIQEVSNSCTCRLLCPNCNICIHRYSCSCVDSSIKWNMCKHIHFLCHSQNLNCHATNEETIVMEEVCQENKSPALTLDKRCQGYKSPALTLDERCQGNKSPALPLDERCRGNKSPALPLEERCQGNKSPALTLEERREALKRKFSDLINSLTHPEKFVIMERNLKYIKSKLNAVKCNETAQSCNE